MADGRGARRRPGDRPLVGHRGADDHDAARRQRRRRHARSSGPTATRSPRSPATGCGTGASAAPSSTCASADGADAFRALAARRRRRRAGVLARHGRAPRHRPRHARAPPTRASITCSITGLRRPPRPRRPSRLRRAGRGPHRAALRPAGPAGAGRWSTSTAARARIPEFDAPEGMRRGADRAGPVFPRSMWPSLGATYFAIARHRGARCGPGSVTGRGQQVETSLLQGALAAVVPQLAAGRAPRRAALLDVAARRPRRSRASTSAPTAGGSTTGPCGRTGS